MTLIQYQGRYASNASRKSGYNSIASVKSIHSLRRCDRCVGCGGNHPWICNGQELCPLKSNWTVFSQAKNYKAWKEARKKRNAKKKCDINFELMDKGSKEKIKKQVLTSMARESREANAGSTIMPPRIHQSNLSSL
jgi:hypothetical protein